MTAEAGPRRRRVVIETMTDSVGARGGVTETPSTLATRWAEIRPLTGAERLRVQHIEGAVTHRIKFRYDTTIAGMSPKHRITFDGRIFDVKAVMNLEERNQALEVLAEEIRG